MMASNKVFKSTVSLLLFLQMAMQVSAGTQFASHVSVNTPARSFTHGVGDPLPLLARRNYNRQSAFRSLPHPPQIRGTGYPRVKPSIPFNNEDTFHRDNSLNGAPWQYNNYMDVAIPVLPPSPYKVDSPDPESLWPEGLFIPPYNPPRFGAASNRRSEVLSENSQVVFKLSESKYSGWQLRPKAALRGRPRSPLKKRSVAVSRAHIKVIHQHDYMHTVKVELATQRWIIRLKSETVASLDPYLLEGSEAIAAVKRSARHGIYYFHDIPHIESLLANQELRIENNLKPHRIASIRHTWPYNRP